MQVAPGLSIHPRTDWGADLPPKAPMGAEDVKFLLVHHTASSNVGVDARSVIRQTYAFQTGPSKRWPDVCYHFFVGPDGSVWEGRAGSLDGPVLADATGGNQGFAQLICLIGNFVSEAPTPAAQESLMRMMIFLADRYRIDADPSATVTFTSRGSDKHRAGAAVTTSTISGHRDTSFTACPGDVAYSLLPAWRSRVHATRLHRDSTSAPRTATRLGFHLE
jgi:N-acetylmuramoyl-L-alanine amidase